jgi:hypothetical protein
VAARHGRDKLFADDRQSVQPGRRRAGSCDRGQAGCTGAHTFYELIRVVLEEGDLHAGVSELKRGEGVEQWSDRARRDHVDHEPPLDQSDNLVDCLPHGVHGREYGAGVHERSRPAVVTVAVRPERSSRFAPSSRSSWRIWAFTPDWLMCTRSAARVKFASSAMLANAPRFEQEPPLPTLVSGDIALTSTPPQDGSGDRAQVARRQPDGTWLRLLDQPELIPTAP